MPITDAQKTKVAQWIADGVKLSDIQNRLATEFDLRLTYMEARLLVDDLKLMPKDPEPPATPAPADIAPQSPAAPAEPELTADDVEFLPPTAGGKVAVAVDTIAIPGAMVSGTVTFSDGQTAKWYVDQHGRLGVVPTTEGYRPPAGDVQEFQVQLDREMQKMGY